VIGDIFVGFHLSRIPCFLCPISYALCPLDIMEPQKARFVLQPVKDSNEVKMLCPVCGYSFTSLTGLDGNSLITVHTHRSDCVLKFMCEKGHLFTYTLEFRRGETFVKLEH